MSKVQESKPKTSEVAKAKCQEFKHELEDWEEEQIIAALKIMYKKHPHLMEFNLSRLSRLSQPYRPILARYEVTFIDSSTTTIIQFNVRYKNRAEQYIYENKYLAILILRNYDEKDKYESDQGELELYKDAKDLIIKKLLYVKDIHEVDYQLGYNTDIDEENRWYSTMEREERRRNGEDLSDDEYYESDASDDDDPKEGLGYLAYTLNHL